MDDLNLRELLDSIFDGVYYIDKSRNIKYWNKAAERITGYSAEEVTGKGCFDNILRHVDSNGVELCKEGCPVSETISDGKTRTAEVYLHHKNGHRALVMIRVMATRDSMNNISGAVEIFSEKTTRDDVIDELEELKQAVYRDPLTESGNRRYVQFILGSMLQNHRSSNLKLGLLFIDADHFKNVNDTHGHGAGDQVLKMISNTITAVLRKNDIVARWGGEEFLVIIPNATIDKISTLSERIRRLIEKSFILYQGTKIEITVSMGVTLSVPEDTIDSIIDRSDALMYKSKELGRNRITSDVY